MIDDPFHQVNNAAPAVPNPPVSEISVSTEKSQPESSAMPSSEVRLHSPRNLRHFLTVRAGSFTIFTGQIRAVDSRSSLAQET